MRSFTPEHVKASESTEATDITPIRYSPRGKILTMTLIQKKRPSFIEGSLCSMLKRTTSVEINDIMKTSQRLVPVVI